MSKTPILAMGELLTEFVSLREGCGLSRTSRYAGPYPSGAPGIFIDQAARMGAKTYVFGGVGDDGFGQIVAERLRRSGVDTRWLACDARRPTGVAFVSYYADGSRKFIFHLAGTAADSFAVPDDFSGWLAAMPPPILHVSGSSLGNSEIRRRIEEAVPAVIGCGGRISVDPNVRKELFADRQAAAALERVLARAAMVFPSQEDVEALLPGAPAQAALAHFHGLGAEIVAITRGGHGCLVSDGSTVISLEGHAVEAVDPTGAGDCFCGTFVAGLAAGASLEDCARRANAAGALSVTRRGPMEGNSGPRQLERFLRAGQAAPAKASAP